MLNAFCDLPETVQPELEPDGERAPERFDAIEAARDYLRSLGMKREPKHPDYPSQENWTNRAMRSRRLRGHIGDIGATTPQLTLDVGEFGKHVQVFCFVDKVRLQRFAVAVEALLDL